MKIYSTLSPAGSVGVLWTLAVSAILTLSVSDALVTRAEAGELKATVISVRGVTRGAAGAPLPGVLVVVHRVDDNSDRILTSGADGEFAISDIKPGLYKVYGSKEGFVTSASTELQLAPLQTARLDLSLQSAQNAGEAAILVEFRAMQKRVEQLEAQLRNGTTQTVTAAKEAPASVEEHESAGQLPLVASLSNPPLGAPLPRRSATGSPAVIQDEQGANDSLWKRWWRGDALNYRDLEMTKKSRTEVASLTSPPMAIPAGQAPAAEAPAEKKKIDPFSDSDWTWLNGNSRTKDSPLDGKYFSGEFRADAHYGLDFNQPVDHTMGGSSELFRSGEVQLEELALGGDFHVDNVRGRVLYLVGLFSTTTPRNDASAAVGQWDVRNAYRYVSEAYGGYHFNVNYGLNIDAGIFVSYVGLFSYHNFDNWAYQPSYVSSNTPWFFNGVRVQWFPTPHLKIEPWFINGWQAYNKFNSHPGLGGQVKWTPKPWIDIISNNYGYGTDTLGVPKRQRYHTDNSIEIKYYDNPEKTLDKMAFSLTGDAGCESGGGVSCTGKGAPKQSFLGWMAYNRFWFKKDLYGVTLGGGQISNPGRYLTLVLPINGADAISGTPYFPGNPGSTFKAYDATGTFDYMPKQYITFRTELGYRHANVPYFSGRHGITPPNGNNGSPAAYVCNDGTPSPSGNCVGNGGLWQPDLRKSQLLLLGSIMVKF